MADVIVVGAGISGTACARVLVAAGHDVTVLDRGRRVGGRMALRRHDGRPVDIGASYFTVSDPDFTAVVDDWESRGLAVPWTDTLTAWSPDGSRSSTGPTRWRAPTGLRELVTDLASGLDVEHQVEVASVDVVAGEPQVDGRPSDAVVLAMPDPQARRIVGPDLGAHLDARFDPVLALTAIWARRAWADIDGVFVNDHPAVSWIADDGARRGDDAPVLVAHSTPELAGRHLDDPQAAAEVMAQAVREVLAIDDDPHTTSVHRWTFARPATTHDEPFLLTDTRIGVCGDAWADKPSVEAAFVSGTRLGEALRDRL